MNIQQISLQNFKCFERQEFDLNPQFTILIGDNGKGKSAILDALAISIGGFLQGIDEAQTRWIQRDEIRLKDFGENIERQLPVVITTTGKFDDKEVTWYRSVETLSGSNTSRGTKSIADLAKVSAAKARNGEEITLPVLVNYATSRLWLNKRIRSRKTQAKGSRLELGYKDCMNPTVQNKYFLQWIKTYELSIIQKQKNADALNAVKHAISQCVEEWDVIFYDFEEDDLVGYSTHGTKEQLPFRLLSDGVRNMIGMIADIAYRCMILNPHLGSESIVQTPGVVLIDELDLHLHPSWQKKVVGDLKSTFPNIQFVASTHSPFIVQSLKSDELINLDQETDVNLQGLGIEEISEGVMGVSHPKSKVFTEMEKVATEYFLLVKQGEDSKDFEEIEQIKERLDELLIPFSEDPAFTAQLKMERLAKLGN
ncbi:MAG: AAA family ATPase [Bacteroidota bacterium]